MGLHFCVILLLLYYLKCLLGLKRQFYRIFYGMALHTRYFRLHRVLHYFTAWHCRRVKKFYGTIIWKIKNKEINYTVLTINGNRNTIVLHSKNSQLHSKFFLLWQSFSPGAALASVRPTAPGCASSPLRAPAPVRAAPSSGSAAARRVVRVPETPCAVRARAPSPLVVWSYVNQLVSSLIECLPVQRRPGSDPQLRHVFLWVLYQRMERTLGKSLQSYLSHFYIDKSTL